MHRRVRRQRRVIHDLVRRIRSAAAVITTTTRVVTGNVVTGLTQVLGSASGKDKSENNCACHGAQ
jgi:hypothetical protein